MRKLWHDVVDDEQEAILVEKSRNGQVLARNKMITSGIRLACAIADRYASSGVQREILVAEGMSQFFTCLEKFDPRQKASFSRYAAWWMKYGMAQVISRQAACCYN